MNAEQKQYREDLALVKNQITTLKTQLAPLEVREQELLKLIVPEVTQCPTCLGARKVDRVVQISPSRTSMHEVKCDKCEGHGVIKETF